MNFTAQTGAIHIKYTDLDTGHSYEKYLPLFDEVPPDVLLSFARHWKQLARKSKPAFDSMTKTERFVNSGNGYEEVGLVRVS